MGMTLVTFPLVPHILGWLEHVEVALWTIECHDGSAHFVSDDWLLHDKSRWRVGAVFMAVLWTTERTKLTKDQWKDPRELANTYLGRVFEEENMRWTCWKWLETRQIYDDARCRGDRSKRERKKEERRKLYSTFPPPVPSDQEKKRRKAGDSREDFLPLAEQQCVAGIWSEVENNRRLLLRSSGAVGVSKSIRLECSGAD